MSKNFPKTVYVTRLIEDDDENQELFIDSDAKVLAEREENAVEVAEYKLVRIGVVMKSSKIVFE